MAGNNRRIWAVMCGAVRLEFELYSTLAILCEWRAQGILEGIVLSTWRGEVEKIPKLREKLKYLDISLLEATPLDQSEEKYTNLNFVRQAIQLNNALNFIPENVFVVKCRTDFSIKALNIISQFLEEDMDIVPFGSFMPCMKNKIAIAFTSVSSPFFSCDIAFFGHKVDLKSMLIFENTVWGWGKPCGPDALFFRNIFIHNYPVVSDFVRMVDSYFLNIILKDKLKGTFSEDNFYLPGILNKFYALYFVILYTCFNLPKSEHITSHSLYTVFQKNNNRNWHVPLDHPSTLDKIVFGKFEQDKGFEKLYKEINKIGIVTNYAKSMEFTEEDYRETIEWGKKFDIPVNRWFNWNKLNQMGAGNKINFENATKILFSDYRMSDQAVSAIKCAAIGEGDYYGKLANNLEVLEESDKTVYEKALFTAARGQDGNVLERIGKMLLLGKVSDDLLNEAVMIFERYKGKSIFYKNATMSIGKILGIYYYGKYATKEQKSDYAEASWRALRAEWRLSREEAGTPVDYAEGIIELAGRKIESSYTEFSENKLIAILTEFLLLVGNGKEFSQEYITFLEEQGNTELAERIRKKTEVVHE